MGWASTITTGSLPGSGPGSTGSGLGPGPSTGSVIAWPAPPGLIGSLGQLVTGSLGWVCPITINRHCPHWAGLGLHWVLNWVIIVWVWSLVIGLGLQLGQLGWLWVTGPSLGPGFNWVIGSVQSQSTVRFTIGSVWPSQWVWVRLPLVRLSLLGLGPGWAFFLSLGHWSVTGSFVCLGCPVSQYNNTG